MGVPDSAQWDQQIAAKLGVAPTPAVIRFIHLWSSAEGGGAANNPFNTTQPGFGETGNYNTAGVKDYATPEQGIDATVHTLQNGKYGNILAAMKEGTSPLKMAQALAASPWGTGGLVVKMLGGKVEPSLPQSNTLPDATPKQAPLPGLPNVGTAPSLQSVFNASAPSDSTVNILGQLGGIAGKTAQAAQAPIALPAADQAPRPLPGFQPLPLINQGKTAAAQNAALPGVGGIAKTALTQIGQPYQWGGQAKLGTPTDCSGLLQASAAANGVKIGRTTYEQWQQGKAVPMNKLKPGDAVFFEPGPQGPQHVAIYVGNGRVVEDPHTGASVHVSELAGRGAIGARRYTK